MTDTEPVLFVDQDVELTDLTSLVPFPGNPHIGDQAAIGASIDEQGYYGAILVQKSTRRILGGEHRWKELLSRGVHEEMCAILDVDDETAKAIVWVDNRAHDLGGYDNAALAAGLAKLPALDGTGYDARDLADMMTKVSDATAAAASTPTAPSPAQGMRPIVLPFPIDVYEELTESLPDHRAEFGVETNAELFFALVRDSMVALGELARG